MAVIRPGRRITTTDLLPAPGPMGVPGPAVQVRLYTAHTVIGGTLRLNFNRLSDQLNFGPSILELGHAELVRVDNPNVHRAQRCAYVHRGGVLMAIDRLSTDYAATLPELRENKEEVPVTADLGHFIVSGTLHSRRGEELSVWLQDGREFVPLTDVTIFGAGDQVMTEPMAILNRAAIGALLV
jgi:hypothetical protein